MQSSSWMLYKFQFEKGKGDLLLPQVIRICSCHTRFMKANRMHLICASGSVYIHMIDYKAIIITSAKR